MKYHHMKDFWIYKHWFDYSHFTEGSLRQRECFCSASKKVIIKHTTLETLLMLYHQLILPPKRCGYLNSQLGFVCIHFSATVKCVCLCRQSTQPLQCHDGHIYASVQVIYGITYFNKRHLFSVTIPSKLRVVLAHSVTAELTGRVKSVQKIQGRLGLSSIRLSHPGFN